MAMPTGFDWVLRILQFALTILTLALSSTLINQQRRGGTPTRINFAVFVSVFSLLSLFFLIPSLLYPPIAFPIVVLALDVLNAILFLSAGIALAAQLSGTSCANRFHLFHNEIANGGGYSDREKRCREAQALTAFLWFAFAVWAGQALFNFVRWARERDEARIYGKRPLSRVGLRPETERGRESGGMSETAGV